MAGESGRPWVDARWSSGVQVGAGGVQVNIFVDRGTRSDTISPPRAGAPGAMPSPYRGLIAFDERDRELFFGRDNDAERVLGRMDQMLAGTGPLVLSGVSGAGKSSLIRAGVLPRLQADGLRSAPEAASWPCVVFAPGRAPLDNLAAAVSWCTTITAGAVRRELDLPLGRFALTVRQAALKSTPGGWSRQPRLLLVVDQFEQLFTLCQRDGERQRFVEALHACATAQHQADAPAALVVLVVRADFEARIANYPVLGQSVQDRYLLRPMDRDQLRLAITRPAITVGSSVDADLVEVLLEDVRSYLPAEAAGQVPGAGAGALPLLSHALDQAWSSRAGHTLTLTDYVNVGGIKKAVAASAQGAYDSLTPEQKAAARQVFTRLVARNGDGPDTAERVSRAELTSGKSRPEDTEAVLETFAARRLLILGADQVEISHEAVLTAWPLLKDWLADSAADRVIRTKLRATAKEWSEKSRDPSYLYSGSRLAAATALTGTGMRYTPLSRIEREFLRASEETEKRRGRRRRALTAALLALSVALAVVAVTAVHDSRESDTERDVAVSNGLVSESLTVGEANATAATLESIAAWGLDHSAQARYAMLAVSAQPQVTTYTADANGAGSEAVAVSPDGKTLATGSAAGVVRLWDIATGQQMRAIHIPGDLNEVESIAFGSGGRTLAVVTPSNASLWSLPTGRRIGVFQPSLFSGISRTALSPDGMSLAIFGPGTSGASLWDMMTGRRTGNIPRLGREAIDALAFSPHGRTAAVAAGNRIVLWNVARRKQVDKPMTAEASGIESMALSPDGKTLAVGGWNGVAQLWNLATGQPAGVPLAGNTGGIDSMAFSPDGTTLATGGDDGTARLWNVAQANDQIGPATNIGTRFTVSAAFNPRGTLVATASNSDQVNDFVGQLWGVATGRRVAGPWLLPGTVIQVRRAAHTTSVPSPVLSVAFSPDGKTIANAGSSGVWLLDAATGKLLSGPYGSASAVEHAVAFSPDGATLAVADDNTARLWDITTRQPADKLSASGVNPILSMAFSPDSTTLATASDTGVLLWSVTNGNQVGSQAIATLGDTDSVAFSPDSTILATGSDTGTIRLWDLATGEQIGGTFDDGTNAVVGLAFGPDGTTLTAASYNGTILRLDTSWVTDPLSYLCARAGGSLTPAEWSHYVPKSIGYRKVCP